MSFLFDVVSGRAVTRLDATTAEIVSLCDGRRDNQNIAQLACRKLGVSVGIQEFLQFTENSLISLNRLGVFD